MAVLRKVAMTQAVCGADLRTILIVGDIAYTVKSRFDSPVTAHQDGDGLGVSLPRREIGNA